MLPLNLAAARSRASHCAFCVTFCVTRPGNLYADIYISGLWIQSEMGMRERRGESMRSIYDLHAWETPRAFIYLDMSSQCTRYVWVNLRDSNWKLHSPKPARLDSEELNLYAALINDDNGDVFANGRANARWLPVSEIMFPCERYVAYNSFLLSFFLCFVSFSFFWKSNLFCEPEESDCRLLLSGLAFSRYR